jgi:hypothetical protein
MKWLRLLNTKSIKAQFVNLAIQNDNAEWKLILGIIHKWRFEKILLYGRNSIKQTHHFQTAPSKKISLIL